MKTNLSILTILILFTISSCGIFQPGTSTPAATPFYPYAWACGGQNSPPTKIVYQQFYGDFRIGYEDTNTNTMIFTGYDWSNLSSLPAISEGITIGDVHYIIIELTNDFTIATTSDCSSYCSQKCSNADAAYAGTFTIMETGQTVCNCKYR